MKNVKLIMVLLLFGSLISCKGNEKISPSCDIIELSFKVVQPSCGSNDGKFEVSVKGGKAPYMFSLNDGISQSSSNFNSLASGLYKVSVTDENKCSGKGELEIVESNSLVIQYKAEASGCGTSEGHVSVEASGGSGNYSFKLNDGQSQSENLFSNLPAGKHLITVSDGKGCSKSVSAAIPSGVSFSSAIKPIINNSCAISGCHISGGSSYDFTVFTNIKNNAQAIKNATANKTMPKKGVLTAEQISAIACWVNDGAMNN